MSGSAAADAGISYIQADLAVMKEMLRLFGEAFEDPASYHENVPSDDYLSSLIEREDFIPIAAVADGKVVGAIAAYVLRKFEQQRSEIYIYDLAVDEAYRRRQIATGMINFLREIARDLGSYVIFVQADPGDDPAIKLYESLGTREDVHHFDIIP